MVDAKCPGALDTAMCLPARVWLLVVLAVCGWWLSWFALVTCVTEGDGVPGQTCVTVSNGVPGQTRVTVGDGVPGILVNVILAMGKISVVDS